MVQDEEAVSEMLSNFPNDDHDPLVRRSDLGLTGANLERKLAQQTTRLVMWMVTLQLSSVGLVLGVVRSWLPT